MGNKTLMDYFSVVHDPRIDRMKRHNLIDILVMAVCGVLSGFDDMTDIADYAEEKQEWFSTFSELPNGVPSHDTFSRVFALIDPESFQQAFLEWLASIKMTSDLREIVSVDGKVLRGALRRSGVSKSAIAIVSAWSHEADIICSNLKLNAIALLTSLHIEQVNIYVYLFYSARGHMAQLLPIIQNENWWKIFIEVI